MPIYICTKYVKMFVVALMYAVYNRFNKHVSFLFVFFLFYSIYNLNIRRLSLICGA